MISKYEKPLFLVEYLGANKYKACAKRMRNGAGAKNAGIRKKREEHRSIESRTGVIYASAKLRGDFVERKTA